MDEFISIPVKFFINIVLWGLCIIIAISFGTFFLYLGVARNELELAKEYIIDEVDKTGGFSDAGLVVNEEERGALSSSELASLVNAEFGGRQAGMITLTDIEVDYSQGNIDYFGNPIDLTLSRKLIVNIAGVPSDFSLNLRTSNGASNRGYMDEVKGVRYELGKEYLEKSR